MTSQFANAMNITTPSVTWNNALSLSSSDLIGNTNGRMSLFFKSCRGLCVPLLYEYISKSVNENVVDTFLLAFNIRDCRGGKGERDLGRKALVWMFINNPLLFEKIVKLIPEYGRWDDLLQFFPGVLELQNIEHVKNNFVSIVSDSNFNILHEHQKNIVRFFGLKIIEDHCLMMEGKPCSIAAKWAPTEGDSLDRKSGVYKTLAKEMNISPRKLRKVYLTPLREYLKIVERFMCTNKWEDINYNKVPSCAMKRLKKSFEKHDCDRFNEWKNALTKNDNNIITKVNAKQLFPHELVREIRKNNMADAVCEAQWKVLEDECLKLGTLEDSVVVVDTSSSMHSPDYIPFDVAISLGLLISNCTKGIFKNHVITFNTNPEFVEIKSGSVFNRWKQVMNIPWGGSTNIQKTFEMILKRGRLYNLTQDDMPKRLWIISDMQFNCVNESNDITNFQAIDKMYNLYGYTRPQIVFWNVNGSITDFPVTSDQNGTALLSGFSPSVMKAILTGGDIKPFSILRDILDSERLKPIKVLLEDEKKEY